MTQATKKSAQVAFAKKAAKLKSKSKTRPTRPPSDDPDLAMVESDAPRATPISESPHGPRGPPRKFHIDKRAAAIAAEPGDDDELMTVVQCANWFGVSVQWLDIGRSRGDGPPFVRLSPNMVRYHRGTVREWLLGRTHHSTAEYAR